MRDKLPEWPEWMSAATAARYIDSTESTLNHWRLTGVGPAFKRVGRMVRYRRQDLDEWVEGR